MRKKLHLKNAAISKKEVTFRKKCSIDKKKGKKLLSKENFIYLFIVLINIVFTIYIAQKTSIHYAKVLGNNILVTNNLYMFFGRKYVNLLIIGFFSLYTILIRKFILKRKNKLSTFFFILLFYFLLDILLFYIFTKRIF